MSDPKQITDKSTNRKRNRALFAVLVISILLGCIWFVLVFSWALLHIYQ